MPTRTPTQPPQQDARPPSTMTVIEAKQLEVVHAFESPNKRALLLGLLGDDEGLYRRFKAVALQNIARNTDILTKCTVESIFDALRQAAEVKLEVSGTLGEGYLIEYRGIATFQAGYRGLMKLARRSGLVDAIDCHVVFEKDVFSVELGTNPAIIHRPPPFGDRGKYTGVYAWARLRTGELIIEPMSLADIEKVRRASKNATGQNSPWVNWWEEMARKSALKRLMKRLPMGEDAESLMRYEARFETEVAEDRQRDGHDRLRESALAALPAVTGEAPAAETPASTPPGQEGNGDTTEGVRENPDGSTTVDGVTYCGVEHPDGSGNYCVEPPDHAHADHTRSPHRDANGDVWPNPAP